MEASLSGDFVTDVTCLSRRGYGETSGFRAGRGCGGNKYYLFYPVFFSIAEERLEEWTLGYQQVIHNAKIPPGAIIQVVATPTYDTKEALGLYKCL